VELVKQLLRRAVLALIGVPVLVITAKLGGWWLAGLLIVLTVPALGEYYSGVQRHGGRPASALGYLCAIAMILAVVFAEEAYRDRLLLLILFAGLVLVFLSCFDRPSCRGAVYDTATTLFGIIYIGLMMTFYSRIRDLDLPTLMHVPDPVFLGGNVSTLMLVLLPAWALDTAAFRWGRAPGGAAWCPRSAPTRPWRAPSAASRRRWR